MIENHVIEVGIMEIVMAVLIGIGLAASAGFRVFTPMLVTSVAAKLGWVSVASNFDWIGSTPALIAFAVATVIEVCSYYIPVIDNVMKTIATPIAAIAGIILTASFIGDMDPLFSWSVAIIGGGGVATVSQLTTLAVRGASTVATAGIGNIFVSIGEGFTAIVMSILSIVLPIIVVLFVGVLLFAFVKVVRKVSRRKKVPIDA